MTVFCNAKIMFLNFSGHKNLTKQFQMQNLSPLPEWQKYLSPEDGPQERAF
jgi:hypothetical protein